MFGFTRSLFSIFTLAVLAAISLLSFGCAETDEQLGQVDDSWDSCGKCDDATLEPIAQTEWLRCFVEVGEGDTDMFVCSMPLMPLGVGHPMAPEKIFHYLDRAFSDDAADSSGWIHAGDSDLIMAEYPRDSYPLELTLDVTLDDSGQLVGFNEDSLRAQFVIMSADHYTEATPLVLEQPFEIWPVSVLVPSSGWYGYRGGQLIDISPYKVLDHAPIGVTNWTRSWTSELLNDVSFEPDPSGVRELYFVAPQDGVIDGDSYSSREGFVTEAPIDGPGHYIAAIESFAPVDAAEFERLAAELASAEP